MDGRAQRRTEPLTRRQKGTIAAVSAAVIAAVGGVSLWGVSHPGSLDRSRNGCITVNVASSMGGSITHACGTQAQQMCQAAFARHDPVSLETQRQCRLAGLAPASSSAP